MHSVATRVHNRGEDRVVHVSHADRTVGLQLLWATLMVAFEGESHAAVAHLAVECVFSASNSAYPTLIAVKDPLLLSVIIVKSAD